MSQVQVESALPAPAARRAGVADILGRFAPLIFLLVLMVVFSLANPNFLQPRNLFSMVRDVTAIGLVALGMTFVILTGGIDLSVGSLLGLTGMVAAIVATGGVTNGLQVPAAADPGVAALLAILAAIGVGILAGFIQGTAIVSLKVPPFIVTLGGLTIFRGLTRLISNSNPVSPFSDTYRYWGNARLPADDGVPISVLLLLVFAAVVFVVLRYTRYGRHVYAVGGNPEAARLSGLNVKRIIISVYVIVGFFAGIAGYILSAYLNSAQPNAGEGYELDVIASVVIGGTSLFGGQGGVPGTVVGLILIGVLRRGLVMLRVNPNVQIIIIGLIVIFAVAFDTFVKSRRKS